MEATPEGLAAAAAAREALKSKKRSLEVGVEEVLLEESNGVGGVLPTPHCRSRCNPACLPLQQQQEQAAAAEAAAKKPQPERPPPSCTHEVAVPPGYDMAAAEKEQGLDPALHGAPPVPSCHHATFRQP